MRELWNMLQAVFTGIGGWLGYFLEGCDGLLYALIAFTVIDYISGVMCGIVDGKLSSSIGFKGICRLYPKLALFSTSTGTNNSDGIGLWLLFTARKNP